MKLVDEVVIKVKAGNGGDGATVTKQLYATKKTAPDGGNGGNGGNVYFKADKNISDLSEFSYKKKIKGIDGTPGSRKDKDGKNGEDITVLVPYGTFVKNLTTGEYVEIISDLPFCVAKGGKGGMGNHDFNPDIRKFGPRAYQGTQGDEYELQLVLKLIADVGIVGLPNAGKSSLLKSLTKAEPKIGDYPFTTLSPNLGVCEGKVLADIPGLIEGASEGRGLGVSFLKHIAKTKVLFHCISLEEDNVAESYRTVRDEFKKFDPALLEKDEIILLTKKDLADPSTIKKALKDLEKTKRKILTVSINDKESLEKVKEIITGF